MRLDAEYIEMLIRVSDADGVYTMLTDYGYEEEAEYVKTKHLD